MRKILEQRLENAKNDYHNCYSDIDNFPFYEGHELKGQIEAYQDCLNLLPPARTEQEILKDFEALGYVIVRNNNSILKMENNNYSIRSLAAEIGKCPKDFTKRDIIDFISGIC